MAILTKENYKNYVSASTFSEVMDNDLYVAVKNFFLVLEKWQKAVLERLPTFKQQIEVQYENQRSLEGQACLINYLKLRSLYGLAYCIWERIDHTCHDMKSHYQDEEGVDKARNAIRGLIKHFDPIPYEEIIKDESTGFFRLHQSIVSFEESMSFLVLESKDGVKPHVVWYYREITGCIAANGLQNVDIWEMAVKSPDPTKTNIEDFLGAEE